MAGVERGGKQAGDRFGLVRVAAPGKDVFRVLSHVMDSVTRPEMVGAAIFTASLSSYRA